MIIYHQENIQKNRNVMKQNECLNIIIKFVICLFEVEEKNIRFFSLDKDI
jgi:hypothetical protein